MRLKQPKRLRKGSPAAQYSGKMEAKLAKRLGGKTTPGSGSGDTKGDVRVHKVTRIEAKATSKRSFRVTADMIEKIEDAALAAGEAPAIEIHLLDTLGKPRHKVAVVPVYVLEMLGVWDGIASQDG